MRKSGQNPGLITGANQVNDRVNRIVSTPECITLPPVLPKIQRRGQEESTGSLPFMERVRENTPKNEGDIRGIRDLEGVEISLSAAMSVYSDMGLKIIPEHIAKRRFLERGATVVD